MPPLSERKDDIPALATHFLDECKDEFGLSEAGIAPSLMRHLVERTWTGNVRELRSLLRESARRAAFELDAVLTISHLPETGGDDVTTSRAPRAPGPDSGSGSAPPTPAGAAPGHAAGWPRSRRRGSSRR